MSYFEDPAEFSVADARHVLLAGDVSSIGEIGDVLAGLPICARGQVFIEVEDTGQIAPLSGPGRVVITWLSRSNRTGDPGTGQRCAAGQAASRAARAWASEMLAVDGQESSDYKVWVGGASAHLIELRNELRMTLAAGAAARHDRETTQPSAH